MQAKQHGLTVRMCHELHARLEQDASGQERSMSQVAARILNAHYGIDSRTRPDNTDVFGEPVAEESRVVYDPEPTMGLEPVRDRAERNPDGSPVRPPEGFVVQPRPQGFTPVPKDKAARLARARAAMGGKPRDGADPLGRKPMELTLPGESRVEYDYEALRASKRAGDDTGRGL